jgi:hypothetical protein
MIKSEVENFLEIILNKIDEINLENESKGSISNEKKKILDKII